MNYWLVKSEPEKFSWDQFVADKKATWDGVRNYAARLQMLEMKKGDQVLFYHSNEGMDIVGIATVTKEHFRDETAEDPRWVAVELKPFRKLKRPVTLKEIKANPAFSNMALVKLSRLSVGPVTADEFNKVLELSEQKG
jgi:predicted RNA-binding protein with PUA-like domain